MAILRIDQTVKAIAFAKVTGASASYALTATGNNASPTGFRWSVYVSNKPYTSFSVTLQTSPDNSSWTTIDTLTTATESIVAAASGDLYVRASVDSLVGGDWSSQISVSITGLSAVLSIPTYVA